LIRESEEVNKLKVMLGATAAKTIFSAFLTESEPLLEQAVEAIEAGDRARAKALLHKLSGVFGSVMAMTPQQLCSQLETALLEDGSKENGKLVATLKDELNTLSEAARAFVHS
jgi:HPt (histidine-containing phosphotransfer) domain-containing protein